MQPMAISASYLSVAASFFAANGNSNEPGTCTTSTSLLLAPARSSASTAAERSRSVIKLLNRLTTIPKRNPAALSPPSILPGWSFSSIVDLRRSFFRSLTSFTSFTSYRPLNCGGLFSRNAFVPSRMSSVAHASPKSVASRKSPSSCGISTPRSIASMAYFTASGPLAMIFLAIASAAEREPIDRADRRLPHGLQQMKNALAIKRKFLAVHRRLLRQFADIGSGLERFFARPGQDQHAHARVLPRVQQCVMQLLDRLAVQRIQHLWPVEGNVRNPLFPFIEQILVSHVCPSNL